MPNIAGMPNTTATVAITVRVMMIACISFPICCCLCSYYTMKRNECQQKDLLDFKLLLLRNTAILFLDHCESVETLTYLHVHLAKLSRQTL